ncbi:type I secretion system permease/ATPase [Sphingomonas ginkgonis]|uniref:type I secretion system permease/ATPase n=1 Tax=Sphingomonas ginkgonis TaxID=2315330 RepID=UPI001EF16013|nr:type I secretion system permease/ATPase [Sphingomonas ginkgonis]
MTFAAGKHRQSGERPLFLPAAFRNSLTVQAALQACRRHFLYAALFSAAANLLFIAPMLYMLQVYDRVVPAQGQTTLLFLTLILIGALLALAGLDALRFRLLVRAGACLDGALAPQVMRSTFLQGDAHPRLARQAMREFDTLRQALTGPAMLGALDAPWIPVYVAVAFLIHFWMGMLAVAGAALIALLAWRNEQETREPLQQANTAAARAYASYDTAIASADVVRALGLREALVRGHGEERRDSLALQTGAGIASARLAAESKFVRLFLQSSALGLGALLAIDGLISPGAIFASSFIVGRAMAPIDQLVGGWRSIVQARGAIAVLDRLLGGNPLDVSRTLLPAPTGRLDVRGLGIATPDRQLIIANISFQLKPGEFAAIVGPSGAGKSTLVRALAGALTPSTGEVRFDGAEQRDWDPEQLARHIGYMPQETVLLAGSVKANISRFQGWMGEPGDAIDEQTVAAARLAGAHDMILALPGGYDHRIELGGRGLSAGQAQRIALARALFRDPAYIILDEPNASLDSEGDAQLIRTLEQLKAQGRTILVVAHRLSMLPVVDRLLVIRDGQLALSGPRDEVMRKLAPPQQQVTSREPAQ